MSGGANPDMTTPPHMVGGVNPDVIMPSTQDGWGKP